MEQVGTQDAQEWVLAPGEAFGAWRVVARLGRGGMGEVYAVEEARTGERFALKLFTAQGGDDDFLRRRFRDMGATLACVRHPRLVRVFRMGRVEAGDVPRDFVLMAMVAVSPKVREAALRVPETLLTAAKDAPCETPVALSGADLLAARAAPPEALLERLWGDAVAALLHLRGLGIVHGDVKPGNLLLSAGGHATLVDFGLARVENPALRPGSYVPTFPDLAGAVRGTPEFLAPELLRGGPPTFEGDLYALGATFFRLRTGMPYLGDGARLLLRELRRPWRARLSALLSADPARRAEALRPRRLVSRRRALVGLGGLGAAVALGGAWAAWRRWGKPPPREEWLSEQGVSGDLRVPPGTTLHFPHAFSQTPPHPPRGRHRRAPPSARRQGLGALAGRRGTGGWSACGAGRPALLAPFLEWDIEDARWRVP